MPDLETIKQYISFLDHTRLTAIRILIYNPATKAVNFVTQQLYHYTNDIANFCSKYSSEGCLVYVGLNERCLDDSHTGFDKNSVVSVNNLIIDLDFNRQDKTHPASREEFRTVAKKARIIQEDFVKKYGIKFPIIMTGNGCQIILTIPKILLTDDNMQLIDGKIKKFTNEVRTKYQDENVIVDTSVADIARISKVVGTMSYKGIPAEDRPHRPVLSMDGALVRKESEELRSYILSLTPTHEHNEPIFGWFNRDIVKSFGTINDSINLFSKEALEWSIKHLNNKPYNHSIKKGIEMGRILGMLGSVTNFQTSEYLKIPVVWYRIDSETLKEMFPLKGNLELSPKKLLEFRRDFIEQSVRNPKPFFISFSTNNNQCCWYFPTAKEFFSLREQETMDIITKVPYLLTTSKRINTSFLNRRANGNRMERIIQGIQEGNIKSLRGSLLRLHLALYLIKRRRWTKQQIIELYSSPSIAHEYNADLTNYHLDKILQYY